MRTTAGRIILWFLASTLAVAFLVYFVTQVIRPAALAAPVPESEQVTVSGVVFYALAGLTVLGAAGVALSRNILYSALGLLMALLGAGSLYVFLSADSVAMAQLLVYVGGVLVLILFAVMLTNRITEISVSNSSLGLFGGVLLFVTTAPVLLAVAALTPWPAHEPAALAPTTAQIGNAFLTKWLLPFEVVSLVLVATLVGAVVMARKEIKAD